MAERKMQQRTLGLYAPGGDEVGGINTQLVLAVVRYQEEVADIAEEFVRKWREDIVAVREELIREWSKSETP